VGEPLVSIAGVGRCAGVGEAQTLVGSPVLLSELLALDHGGALVNDLVGVDGGLHNVLSEVLLSPLHNGHGTLAVDDGLNLINHIGVQLLLNNGLALNDATLGGSGLDDVLLDVMHNVLVDLTMDDGLNLHNSVLADCLLDYGCHSVGDLLLPRQTGLHHALLYHARLLQSCRGGDASSWVSVGELVKKSGHLG